MIISINGPEGSGKSTLAKKLAETLGWPRYYMGGLRRKMAKERGLTLEEYNKLGETDPTTDKEVDDYQKKLGETEDNFIIEGRTSWFFIPHSLKLYIDVKDTIAAARIWKDLKENSVKRNEGKNLDSVSDVLKSIRRRQKSDIVRYKKYYKIDVHDKSHYDFIINTSKLSADEAFAEILSFVKKAQY